MTKTIRNVVALSAMAMLLQVFTTPPSQAQTVTISQRQQRLMEKISRAEKSGELTVKEANNLRKASDKITDREARMRAKNGGKLSYEDINSIENDLNRLSTKLHKDQLAKRVAD